MKCGELHMLKLKWQATTMIYLVLALVTREANRWVIITNLERENQKKGSSPHYMLASDVRAWLGLARPDDGLRKSKPEPQALKSLSWPKPWAQAAALHT